MRASNKHLPGPLSPFSSPLRVDDFSSGGLAYFLTHAHEDHLYALNDKWSRGLIYCTAITQKLVLQRFPGLTPELFHVMQVGERKLVSLLPHCAETVCVSVFDANHCAGSCMFLFESTCLFGACGAVLHTGDFRFEDVHLPKDLLQKLQAQKSCIYLDNTFGLKTSPSFPPRRRVLDVMLNVLKLYPQDVKFVFEIKSLGKEELLVECSKVLGSKVCVDDARMQKLGAFFAPKDLEYFGVEATDCRLFCSPATAGEGGTVVQVKVSGWGGMQSFELLKLLERKRPNDLPTEIKVPYSLHSTRGELDQFLRAVKPEWVIPTVYCTAEHRNDLFVDKSPAPLPMPFTRLVVEEEKRPPSVLASPRAHAQRLHLKKTRFVAGGEEVKVLFRKCEASWTEEEDLVLAEMWQARKQGQCRIHSELRAKLPSRTDLEIITRSLVQHSTQN